MQLICQFDNLIHNLNCPQFCYTVLICISWNYSVKLSLYVYFSWKSSGTPFSSVDFDRNWLNLTLSFHSIDHIYSFSFGGHLHQLIISVPSFWVKTMWMMIAYCSSITVSLHRFLLLQFSFNLWQFQLYRNKKFYSTISAWMYQT